MRKYLNNPWIVTALVLGAVAFVWSSLGPTRVVVAPQLATSSGMVVDEAVPEEPARDEVGALSIEEALKAIKLTAVPADPFAARPKAESTGLPEQPAVPDIVDTVKLSAIWTQGGRTYVVINDRIHEAGDEISRIKIESASQQGVWVAHWKGRDFVSLGDDFTLVTPAYMPMRAASL
jgi:hypothetical protein